MSIFTSRHYGVTISVAFNGVTGCCGAQFLHDFKVDGSFGKLTMGQKHEMYKDIMRQVVDACSGVVNATDCVLNFGEWSDLERGSSQWKKSDSAGDISMENFCEYFEFERGPVAKNKNSGNLVATFSLAIYAADPNNDSNVTKFKVDKPDFSDEPKPKPGADVKEILSALEELLS